MYLKCLGSISSELRVSQTIGTDNIESIWCELEEDGSYVFGRTREGC